jgi:HAD superfamily hydrolase (TIGR01484 family)
MIKTPFTNDMKFDVRNTLFVSDLDGTLLGPDATLPEGALDVIRELTALGVKLTYSTARTIRSAKFILDGVPFTAPIGLMNGVLLRDMNAGKYVSGALLDTETAEWITSLGGEPFVYTLTEDEELFTAYRNLKNQYMEDFLRERVDKYSKPFRKLDDFHTLIDEGQRIIYFCYLDAVENLAPIRDAIVKNVNSDGSPRAKCALYPDNYRDGLYYLEVFAPSASKGGVTRKLRELTGARTVVSFGDNGNDLPMFEESDFAFAVDRAADHVKAAADGVVAPGMGVLEFIKNHIK